MDLEAKPRGTTSGAPLTSLALHISMSWFTCLVLHDLGKLVALHDSRLHPG